MYRVEIQAPEDKTWRPAVGHDPAGPTPPSSLTPERLSTFESAINAHQTAMTIAKEKPTALVRIVDTVSGMTIWGPAAGQSTVILAGGSYLNGSPARPEEMRARTSAALGSSRLSFDLKVESPNVLEKSPTGCILGKVTGSNIPELPAGSEVTIDPRTWKVTRADADRAMENRMTDAAMALGAPRFTACSPDSGGGHLLGYGRLLGYTGQIPYAEIVQLFGEPNSRASEDGFEVFTSWHVRDVVTGAVLEIYDPLGCNDLPSAKEFRARPEGYNWHIHGTNEEAAISLTVFIAEKRRFWRLAPPKPVVAEPVKIPAADWELLVAAVREQESALEKLPQVIRDAAQEAWDGGSYAPLDTCASTAEQLHIAARELRLGLEAVPRP